MQFLHASKVQTMADKKPRGRPPTYTEDIYDWMAEIGLYHDLFPNNGAGDRFRLPTQEELDPLKPMPTLSASRRAAQQYRVVIPNKGAGRTDTAPRKLFDGYRKRFGHRTRPLIESVEKGDAAALAELKAALRSMLREVDHGVIPQKYGSLIEAVEPGPNALTELKDVMTSLQKRLRQLAIKRTRARRANKKS